MVKLLHILNEIQIQFINWENLEQYQNNAGALLLGDGKHFLDIDTVNNLLLIYNKKSLDRHFSGLFKNDDDISKVRLINYIPIMKQMYQDGHYKLIK